MAEGVSDIMNMFKYALCAGGLYLPLPPNFYFKIKTMQSDSIQTKHYMSMFGGF